MEIISQKALTPVKEVKKPVKQDCCTNTDTQNEQSKGKKTQETAYIPRKLMKQLFWFGCYTKLCKTVGKGHEGRQLPYKAENTICNQYRVPRQMEGS